MAGHMAGFTEQPKLKRRKFSLKVRKALSDFSSDDVDESSVSSEFSESTAASSVIDLTGDEDTTVTDNRVLDTGPNGEDEHQAAVSVDPDLRALRKRLATLSEEHYRSINTNNDWQSLQPFPALQDEADNTRTKITCRRPGETDTITLAGHTFPWKPFPKPCVSCLCRKPITVNHKVLEDETAANSKDYSARCIGTVSAVNSNNNLNKFSSSSSDSSIQKNAFGNGNRIRQDETVKPFSKEATRTLNEHQGQSHRDLVNDHSHVKKRPPLKTARSNSASSSKRRTVNIEHIMKTITGENHGVSVVKASNSRTSIGATETFSFTVSPAAPPPAKNVFSSTSTSPTPDTLPKCPLCQTVFSQSMTPVDKDGHIAACYQASAEDFTW